MRFLSPEESRRWAQHRGHRVNDAFGRPLATEVSSPVRFRIPSDAGARVVLARVLWEAAATGALETLVWVTDWGVWPSGEYMPLADATRRGLGAETGLAETPGHVVRLGEESEGLCVVTLAILFLWDCWILTSDQRPAVFLSHDEYGVLDIRGDDEGLTLRLSALQLLEQASTDARTASA